jgi:hypothetical protein
MIAWAAIGLSFASTLVSILSLVISEKARRRAQKEQEKATKGVRRFNFAQEVGEEWR